MIWIRVTCEKNAKKDNILGGGGETGDALPLASTGGKGSKLGSIGS